MPSERSSALSRREMLALSSLTMSTSLAGCTGLRTQVRELRLGEPKRQVAADWKPAPGQWPMSRYDYAQTNHNPFATPPRSSPEVAWTYDDVESFDSFVVVDDTVFVRRYEALVALNAIDGSERWRRSRESGGSLKYVAGRLYDVERDRLRALTLDGTEIWSTKLDRSYFSVLERDGSVFLLFQDRDAVVRLHADTGDVVSKTDIAASAPATAGGPVYGGRFVISAFDVEDGEFVTRWSVDAERPYDRNPPLVYADGLLYRAGRATADKDVPPGRLSIYDADDGSKRAGVSFDYTPRPPAVDGDSVYVSTAAISTSNMGIYGRLVALSPDGEERWSYESDASLQAPVLADDAVYVGPFANPEVPLIAFDATTGEELWQRDVRGLSTLAVAGDTLYAVTSEGLLALRDSS